MTSKKHKQVLKFLNLLTQLEIIEAIGVARLLNVQLVTREENQDADEQKTASITEKDYNIIMSEMIDAFVNAPKEERRFIIKVMKSAVKSK